MSSFDTTYRVETPEGIDLEAQLAGPIPRALAYAIDSIIRGVIVSVLSIALLLMGKMGLGIFLVFSFLLEWFYPVVYEVYRQGQTPGKRAFGLTVVNDDLTPVTWGASMTRNLLRVIDFLPFAYLAGLISISVGRYFQRLGDLAGGTIVIHQTKLQKVSKLPDVKSVMPPIPLSISEQAALVSFTQRHQKLTQSRQEELADILKPITHREPAPAVNFLQGIGVWLLGSR